MDMEIRVPVRNLGVWGGRKVVLADDGPYLFQYVPPHHGLSVSFLHTHHSLQDWTREEIQALYDMPFIELLYRAATVHRMFWNPREVQQCTLLSIKTGGCTEDCKYCSQVGRYACDEIEGVVIFI